MGQVVPKPKFSSCSALRFHNLVEKVLPDGELSCPHQIVVELVCNVGSELVSPALRFAFPSSKKDFAKQHRFG